MPQVGAALHFESGERLRIRPHPDYGCIWDPADMIYEYSNLSRAAVHTPTVRIRKIWGRSHPELFPASAHTRLRRGLRVASGLELRGIRFDVDTVQGRPRYFLAYCIREPNWMWDYAYQLMIGESVFTHSPLWMNAGCMDGDAILDIRARSIGGGLYRNGIKCR
jgi:hypothetical protein